MKRNTRSVRFAALLTASAFAIVACGSSSGDSSDVAAADSATTVAAAPDATPAPTEAAPVTEAEVAATTPEATEGGGTITYAAEQEFTSYNNATADQVLFANTLILNMTQPGPFISNPDLTLTLWDDMMESAEVTSEDPQTVVYKIKPEAVWTDGEAIDCYDFYLAWISQNGKLTKPNPDFTGRRRARCRWQRDPRDPVRCSTPPAPPATRTSGRSPAPTTARPITTTLRQGCSSTGRACSATCSRPTSSRRSPASPTSRSRRGDGNHSRGHRPRRVLEHRFLRLRSRQSPSRARGTRSTRSRPGQNLILKRNEKFCGTPGSPRRDRLPAGSRCHPAAGRLGERRRAGHLAAAEPRPGRPARGHRRRDHQSIEQGVTFEHYDFNQANEHLADINVRKALALCIDREEIVDTLVAPINPDATVLNNRMYIPSSPDYADNSGGLTRGHRRRQGAARVERLHPRCRRRLRRRMASV